MPTYTITIRADAPPVLPDLYRLDPEAMWEQVLQPLPDYEALAMAGLSLDEFDFEHWILVTSADVDTLLDQSNDVISYEHSR